ncbi:MAG: L-seryl-tRNA(Sec) selenium transferase [Actinomycetia bacterium]|nr:L-seryl-tRNA(Sec) selenium transferase [Actinomycetes bacterium]
MEETPNRLRELPSVDRVLADPRVVALAQSHGREPAVDAVRRALAFARQDIQAGGKPGDLLTRVEQELAAILAPRLRRVINATGVVIHTNLGRAPLSEPARARIDEIARGYSNLELDLDSGVRGSRQDHVAEHLRELTGAESALVVNNNAAALLIVAAALAKGREVVVSRGELVEIGDGFRIPDVLARSGAQLVEVGTTNRTRTGDYEQAIGAQTALLLRVHPSNFRIMGFTERPALSELARLAERAGVWLVDDLGSGSFVQLPDEPTAAESVRAGSHIVTFSGDKLLGGPQAGIICGRAELLDQVRRHPLQRALRADKLTVAALEGTLALYRSPERARKEVPALRMLEEPAELVRKRAAELARLTGGSIEPTTARAGGGALPLWDVPSYACALDATLAQPLRCAHVPVIGMVRENQLLLDCRTVADGEVAEIARAVADARP